MENLENNEKRKEAFLNVLIKNEKLNLKGHELGWQKNYTENMLAGKEAADYARPIFKAAEDWGKLMQLEMKRQNSSLTAEIVKRTEALFGDWGIRARVILVSTWIHGKELGKILGWSEATIINSRKNFSNIVISKLSGRERA